MATFTRGDVVVVPFPYSDAPGEKLRPALVLASWNINPGIDDCLVCMITSQNIPGDVNAISLQPANVTNGVLTATSFLRPTYLYSVQSSRIRRKVGDMGSQISLLALKNLKSVLE